ncbi:MAG: DUF3810 domain-containing protein [Lachnospiraceae bacterium]|nr:DUF3810 domain-containing protein [Lachnospiraceae bacterium]
MWLYIGIGVLVILLNIAAWNSTTFCDAYIAYVFPIWVNTYGRLTGVAPFSVGEILLGLGVMLLGLAGILWIPWLVTAVVRKLRKKSKPGAGRGFRIFYRFFAWTLLIVCLIMTLNCFILYHASTFSENYFGEDNGEYTLEELITVRNMVVEECNRLSLLMERDEEGNILYDGDLEQTAIESMQKLGKTYGRLDGYYPRPKPLYTSDFFSQQYMCGYYFPFSMEANYNTVMYIMNKPSTLCHELAHLRGYIFEDEANFISYLACIQSDDIVYQYSGYLSVLNYLDNDFYKAVGRDRESYLAQPRISSQVSKDNVFVTDDEWERINGNALIDTETVEAVSDAVVDTTLKVNGVQDGMISYSRVVRLLLLYYSYGQDEGGN